MNSVSCVSTRPLTKFIVTGPFGAHLTTLPAHPVHIFINSIEPLLLQIGKIINGRIHLKCHVASSRRKKWNTISLMTKKDVYWYCNLNASVVKWASNEELFQSPGRHTRYRILVRELIYHAGRDLCH
jgi:hypothetical protein